VLSARPAARGSTCAAPPNPSIDDGHEPDATCAVPHELSVLRINSDLDRPLDQRPDPFEFHTVRALGADVLKHMAAPAGPAAFLQAGAGGQIRPLPPSSFALATA
jgi:hypothetical protein